jgi:hypothetical protein
VMVCSPVSVVLGSVMQIVCVLETPHVGAAWAGTAVTTRDTAKRKAATTIDLELILLPFTSFEFRLPVRCAQTPNRPRACWHYA